MNVVDVGLQVEVGEQQVLARIEPSDRFGGAGRCDADHQRGDDASPTRGRTTSIGASRMAKEHRECIETSRKDKKCYACILACRSSGVKHNAVKHFFYAAIA